MVFMPQRLLQEKLRLKEAKVTVDPKIARSLYFRAQGVLEETTGEPCWFERGYVIFLCAVAASLAVASAYYAFTRYGLIALAMVGIAAFAAITFETLLVRHLTHLISLLLIAFATVVATTDAAWPKFLTGAALVYFLSFAFASRVTFVMMMRNDRAYRALYRALRIHFADNE
jgi:hypothetical protein